MQEEWQLAAEMGRCTMHSAHNAQCTTVTLTAFMYYDKQTAINLLWTINCMKHSDTEEEGNLRKIIYFLI